MLTLRAYGFGSKCPVLQMLFTNTVMLPTSRFCRHV